MSGHIYYPFSSNDKFETKVLSWPSISWWSGSNGLSGSMGMPSGSLSLYSGIRARFDVGPNSTGSLNIYPLDQVNTYSIDKVISISGSYPATGTINIVNCTNTDLETIKLLYPTASNTDTRWYDNYYRPIEILHRWYSGWNTTYELFNTGTYSNIWLFHIPSMYYDQQIATGTIIVTDWTHQNSGSSPDIFVDDGRGSLIRSGTTWLTLGGDGQLHRTGTIERWGTVFYAEGLIVILPPAASSSFVIGAGVGSLTGTLTGSNAGKKVQLDFSGTHPIITKTFMCRLHENEGNCSRNPTWSFPATGSNGTVVHLSKSGPDNTTYITSIGLYNEDYELVAVAKIAQPIRKRERDRLDIRLRLDF